MFNLFKKINLVMVGGFIIARENTARFFSKQGRMFRNLPRNTKIVAKDVVDYLKKHLDKVMHAAFKKPAPKVKKN
jgi:hypothetical protein